MEQNPYESPRWPSEAATNQVSAEAEAGLESLEWIMVAVGFGGAAAG